MYKPTPSPEHANGYALAVYCEGCAKRLTDTEYAQGAGLCARCDDEAKALVKATVARAMDARTIRGGQGRTPADVSDTFTVLALMAGVCLAAGAFYGFVLLVRAIAHGY